jgi:GNAT superfamily N-acetyltransferase
MSYIFPDAQRRARRLPRLFALLFHTDAGGWRIVNDERSAATLWRAPGEAEDRITAMIRHLPALLGTFGTALPRALRVADAIAAHHPREPFWYLHIAGVDPTMQGRGVGGQAIRAGLARADEVGLPVYLETPLESNVALYRALGFKLIEMWQVPGNGPRFWSMLRAVGGSARA